MRLLSRNDLSMNGRYPEIAEALDGQERTRFAVDGEVVAADGTFAGLAEGRPRLYYVFDVLWLDGEDVRDGRCASARRCCATRCAGTTRSGSRHTASRPARSCSRRPARRAGRA